MKINWLSPIIICLFMSGCSGIKNIQDLTYIVAIGMDYDKEKQEYTVFLQGLNFAEVAKQEGGKSTEPVPIFIAKATGKTLNLAVRQIYRKSEPPLFFGHVKMLVLSQNVVEHKFEDVIEEIDRNRSFRPTLRLVTTTEDVEKVLNMKALFEYPAVYTVLFKKNEHEVAQDELRTVTLMQFLRKFHEPMGIAKLPSVKIDSDSWQADKPFPVLYFDGYTVFKNQKLLNTLPFQESLLLNWLVENHVSIIEEIEEDGKLLATIKLMQPKWKITYDDVANKPKGELVLSVRADLLERVEDVPLERVKQLIEDKLSSRIKKLYLSGVGQKTDFLNIGEKWYRFHPKEYRELVQEGGFYLDKDSITDLQVKVQVLHFNSYKYEKREMSNW